MILEMRYAFRCFPEFSTGTITYEDASRGRVILEVAPKGQKMYSYASFAKK